MCTVFKVPEELRFVTCWCDGRVDTSSVGLQGTSRQSKYDCEDVKLELRPQGNHGIREEDSHETYRASCEYRVKNIEG